MPVTSAGFVRESCMLFNTVDSDTEVSITG